ncbi:MFS transporter [Sphingobium sp. SCG-1]|uniref:MFS transporter n=1 Tax=Sphingobium sp. SCG-1 TaxID=2072936 RepID=UPI0016706C2F|nr:MFS transporter [Sphingobium sp. SCG-1]
MGTRQKALDASLAAPLRAPLFRRLWVSSMMGNLGLMIQAVGSAWAMTKLTDNPEMVALVQTALMMPVMIFAVPAGALADMFDRRKVGIFAVMVSVTGVICLFSTAAAGLLDARLLLFFCFTIGTGSALFGPAWQASAAEVVSRQDLPHAIALNSMSYNAARAIGPAIGGFVVASWGAAATFGINAVLYLPLLLVLFTWRRTAMASRLPAEGFGRAITSGGRYFLNSPVVRNVIVRAFITGMAAASITALLPLIARDIIGGGPQTFGACLGAYGLGAILSAFFLPRIRSRFSEVQIVISCLCLMSASILVVAFSGHLALALMPLLIFGGAWLTIATIFNVGIQTSAPRWVAARAVAAYQASIAGGVALGSWLWGTIADETSLVTALLSSAAAVLLTILVSRRPLAETIESHSYAAIELPPLETAMALTDRSGPILVEIEYRIDPEQARRFYRHMEKVRASRARLGAYSWMIARDIADPWLWTERFHWPTWLDYLRHRTRHTSAERELQDEAKNFHIGSAPIRIRRWLERPYGSVRWQEGALDPRLEGSPAGSPNI